MSKESPLGIPVPLAARLRESVNFDPLEEWATQQMQKAISALVDPAKDEIPTAVLRGEIIGYKALLGLRAKVEQTLDGVKNS